MHVVYHAATLMPSTESDTQFIKKKSHTGNDLTMWLLSTMIVEIVSVLLSADT